MSVTANTLKNRETTMKRILIVEDEQAIREMVGFALKKAELYFEEVADAEQALVAVASNPPARFLYIYVNKHPNKPLALLEAEFLKLVLSKSGQTVVVKDGYIPLPAKVAEQELLKLH